MAVTERVTILMDPAQKAALTARAKAQGISAGEYLRLAAEKFVPEQDEGLDLERLSQVLAHVARVYQENHAKIAETAKFIDESEARMAAVRGDA